MKKYRIELLILGLLTLFLTALSWKPISNIWKYLPVFLLILEGAAILFLAGSQFRQPSSIRGEKYAPKEFLKITISCLMGIAITFLVVALSRRETFSTQFDLTTNKSNSLKPETLKILSKLNKDVQIYCVPPLRPTGADFCAENRRLRTLLAQNSPRITHRALSLQNPEDVALLSSFTNIGYGALVIKSGDYISEVSSPDESKVANALLNLLMGDKKKQIHILVGSSEVGLNDTQHEGESYAFLRDQLLAPRHYEVIEHNYISQGPIPADARVVLVGPSRSPYPPYLFDQLRAFIARGGKLVISINPFVRDLGLEEFLKEVGVLYSSTKTLVTDIHAPIGESLSRLNPFAPIAVGNFSRISQITSQFPPRSLMIVPSAVALGSEVRHGEGYTIKNTPLMSSMMADEVAIDDLTRQKLLKSEPVSLSVSPQFQRDKTYQVAYHVEITNPQALYSNFQSDQSWESKRELLKEIQGDKAKFDPKAEIAVFGFELVHRYVTQTEIAPYLPFFTLAHFHADDDLLSFDSKLDTKKKGLDLSKNPEGYLYLFVGILPITSLLTALRFSLRRRRT